MRHLMHKQMLWISSPSFSICASFCYWVSLCFVTERNLNSCFNLAFSSSVLCLSHSIQDLLQKFKTAWICNEVCISVANSHSNMHKMFVLHIHTQTLLYQEERILFISFSQFALTCPTFDLWKNDMHAHTCSWCRNVSASHLTPFLFVCVCVPSSEQTKSNLKVTSPEDAEHISRRQASPNGTAPSRGDAKGSRTIPRRHTLGGARSTREILAMQPPDMDKKREAFLEHLKQKYPHHASAIMGHQERLREQVSRLQKDQRVLCCSTRRTWFEHKKKWINKQKLDLLRFQMLGRSSVLGQGASHNFPKFEPLTGVMHWATILSFYTFLSVE